MTNRIHDIFSYIDNDDKNDMTAPHVSALIESYAKRLDTYTDRLIGSLDKELQKLGWRNNMGVTFKDTKHKE